MQTKSIKDLKRGDRVLMEGEKPATITKVTQARIIEADGGAFVIDYKDGSGVTGRMTVNGNHRVELAV